MKCLKSYKNTNKTGMYINLYSYYATFIYFNHRIFALIWTTTPWTLPSNQAVCYNPNLIYAVVQKPQEQPTYIVAVDLLDSVSQSVDSNLNVLETLPGSALASCTYFHPVYKNKTPPLLPGDHAGLKGTGLVHTAAAHGPEDFLVALEDKIPVVSL